MEQHGASLASQGFEYHDHLGSLSMLPAQHVDVETQFWSLWYLKLSYKALYRGLNINRKVHSAQKGGQTTEVKWSTGGYTASAGINLDGKQHPNGQRIESIQKARQTTHQFTEDISYSTNNNVKICLFLCLWMCWFMNQHIQLDRLQPSYYFCLFSMVDRSGNFQGLEHRLYLGI